MADEIKSLHLSVDASVELLRRNLATGEGVLNQFEKSAQRSATRVDDAIGSMGKRFGAFADLAKSAADRAQQSFESSFSQVQRLAATALKGPTEAGNVNLGVGELREASAEARRRAQALDLIAEASRRTAAAEQDTSEATRLFIQASVAAKIEAEKEAAALAQQAGALERLQIELQGSATATELFVNSQQRLAGAAQEQKALADQARSTAQAERELANEASILRAALDPMFAAQQRFDQELERADRLYRAGTIGSREYAQAQQLARDTLSGHAQAVAGTAAPTLRLAQAQGSVVVSSGQLRAGTQQLSYQIGDVAASFASGTPIIQIFGQQIGQTIQAVTLMRGEAGGLIGFLAGPWGAALTGAVVVAGALASKLLDGADAHDTQAGAAKSLEDALHDLAVATGREVQTSQQAEVASLNTASAMLQREVATRRATKAALEQALADERISKIRSQAVGERGDMGALDAFQDASRVSSLQALLDKQDKAIGDGATAVRQRRAVILQRQVTEATDASAAATGRYERALGRLNAEAANGLDPEVYKRRLTEATNTRDATLKAIQEANRKPKAPKKERYSATLARENIVIAQDAEVSNHIGAAQAIGDSAVAADVQGVKKIAEEAIRGVEAFYEQAEQRTNDLAATFYDALSGRAGSFWDSFRRLGLSAVAQIAARLLTNNAGAGGSFGDILKSAGSSALGSLFGGAFAAGGDPPLGKVSLVGERGPELFVPKVPGTIIPNHALGGAGAPRSLSLSMTVNGVSNRAEMEAIGVRAAQAAYQQAVATSGRSFAQLSRPSLPGSLG